MIFRNPDAVLVRQTLAGRTEAFAELVQRHLGAASAFALSRLRTKSDAEEVTQESFVRAFERLNTLRDPGKFGPWLLGIVRNCAGRIHEKRRTEVALGDTDMEQAVAGSADSAGDEIFAELRRLVDALPDTQREVVMLRYFSDCSSREIGALLDLSPAAVRKQLERARKQLGRKMLEQVSDKFEWDRDLAKKTLALVAASSAAWMGAKASAAAGTAAGGLDWYASPLAKGAAILVTVSAAIVAFRLVSGSRESDTKNEPAANVAATQELAAEPVTTATNDLQTSQTTPARAPEPSATVAAATNPADALDAGVSIFGVAVDPAGDGVANAKVSMRILKNYRMSASGRRELEPILASATARTDARGEFRFEGLDVPVNDQYMCEIEVESPERFGFERFLVLDAGFAGQPFEVPMVKTEPLAGRVVTLEGEPLANAKLMPLQYEGRMPRTVLYAEDLPPFTTDASGGFSTTRLYEGRWKFFVQAEGRAPMETDFIETGASDATIKMAPGSKLAGRLVCSDCELPASDMKVYLSSVRHNYEFHIADVDPASGRFKVSSLSEGYYFIAFKHENLVIPGDQVMFQISGRAATVARDVPVMKGGEIEGRLIDAATHEGVAGVAVRTEPPASWQSSVTDSNGYFRITGIPAGDYQVVTADTPERVEMVATNSNHMTGSWIPLPVHVEAGSRVTVPDRPMDRSHRAQVTVLDVDGTPARHALVQLRPRGENAAASAILKLAPVWTNADGVAITYLPGTIENMYLRAIARGKASHETGPFSVGASPAEVTLQLEPAGSISGRMLGRAGQVEKGRALKAAGAETGPIFRLMSDGMTHLTSLSPQLSSSVSSGRFYFAPLVADSYTVVASERGTSSATVDLTAGEHRRNVDIPLYPESGTLITGRALLRGAPIPNCWVMVDNEQTKTDDDGRFVTAARAARISRLALNLSRDYRGISIRQGLKVKGGAAALEKRPLEFEFSRGPATVEGVLYKNGRPWSNAQLMAVTVWPDGVSEEIDVTTSRQGGYRFEGLPVGANRLRVDVLLNPSPEQEQMPIDLNLPEGLTSGHDIYLDSGLLRVDTSGIKPGEAGLVRLIPGTEVITALSEEVIEKMRMKDVAGHPFEMDGQLNVDVFEPGHYTLYVAMYNKNARSVAEAMPSIRFKTAPIEIVMNRMTSIAVDLDRGASAPEIGPIPAPRR